MQSTIQKKERIEARITKEQKELFQRAAEIQGRTLTDFVVNSLQEAAGHAIKEFEMISLTDREREIFVEAMLYPPKPNKKLAAAAKAYNRKGE